jgi:hypothetical protein
VDVRGSRRKLHNERRASWFVLPKWFVYDYANGDNTDGAQGTYEYVVEEEYIRSVLYWYRRNRSHLEELCVDANGIKPGIKERVWKVRTGLIWFKIEAIGRLSWARQRAIGSNSARNCLTCRGIITVLKRTLICYLIK